MYLQLAAWNKIKIMGGGTNFLHALDHAKIACEAAPVANLKVVLLFTDGIADDWSEVIERMIEMEKETQGSHFMIMGVTENQRKFYNGYNFPRPETLKALGKTHEARLVMLSREEDMVTLEPRAPRQCVLNAYGSQGNFMQTANGYNVV